MADQTAVVSKRRRIPAIWFVPIVAGLLGIWMVVYTMMNEGPTITITFETAEGIEAGKTKVKSLSVEVGMVQEVRLNENLEGVTVVAKLHPEATSLLRETTRFWVVRPRLGAGGVSGLGTIMSGAYIELQPGQGAANGQLTYEGLEDVPLTPLEAPGLWLTLIGKRVGSISVGQPVLFRGYPVGKVEERRFDPKRKRVLYRIFIEEPYEMLVDEASRFWNASGIRLNASAAGVDVSIDSLQTLIAGGVAFDLPDGSDPLGPAKEYSEFRLFDSKGETQEVDYEYALPVVVLLDQSIRGLVPGAPVEYRGVRVGVVRKILLEAVGPRDELSGEAIPIVIELEPARIGGIDAPEALDELARHLRQEVERGLRASLETGNLITGSLFVALDFFPEAEPAEVGSYGEFMTLPAVASGLEGIGRQVSGVLAKVNDLPIDKTVAELNRTLGEVRRLFASQEVEKLPASVNQSLAELNRTLESLSPGSPVYDQLDRAVTELTHALQSVESVTRTLNEQPNAIIFDKSIEPDPVPGR